MIGRIAARSERHRGLLPAAASGLAALLLLGVLLPADPAPGFTYSLSPFTDEGWIVMGARNLALLGTWTTDELHLYLVQLPYNVAAWVIFELFGVGIVQARVVGLTCAVGTVALTAGLAGWRLGLWPGLVAGIGLTTSTLFLYYGRLALLEAMVCFFLVCGLALLLAAPERIGRVLGLLGGGALALAIGAKANALFPAAGLVLGLLVPRDGRARRARLGVAATAVVAAGLLFGLFVALFRSEEIGVVLRFVADPTLPASLEELWVRSAGYLLGHWQSDRAIVHAAPLLVGGSVGWALGAWRWRHLAGEQRLLVAAAVGWFVVGAAFIMLVGYRPNRYAVPVLPPLAILSAVGLGLLLDRLPPRRFLGGVVALSVTAIMAAPGVMAWSGWLANATYRLPEIQAQVLEIVDDGAAMEGGPAPLFGMREPVPAIVPRPQFDFNDGDLYASHGVRWVVAGPDYEPVWIDAHPGAWARREVVACYDYYPTGPTCLIHVP